MTQRSCVNCIHKEVCKFYAGALLQKDYSSKDFIVEIRKLQKELGSGCPDYKEVK